MTPEYIQMMAYVLFLACCFHHLKSKSALYFLSSFVYTRIRSTNYVIIYFLMGMVYLRKIGESSLRVYFKLHMLKSISFWNIGSWWFWLILILFLNFLRKKCND